MSFGSAGLLLQHLGVLPGAVTPFAAINDTAGAVSVVLDAAMMAHEVLNFHPLVNTMTTSIAAPDLLTFLKATGHEPRILQVSDAAPARPPAALKIAAKAAIYFASYAMEPGTENSRGRRDDT